MPFCPECRSEYRREITTCPTCRLELVEEADLPEALTDEEIFASMSEEELISVARGGLDGCREIQQMLLENQIPAIIRKVEDVVVEAGHFLALEVLIRAEDSVRKDTLFRQEWAESMRRDGLASGALTFALAGDAEPLEEDEESDGVPACPACGSTEPLEDGECPDCGLFLGDDE
ncbi:MAG: hypothetical protein ABI333_10685 [bacterium]